MTDPLALSLFLLFCTTSVHAFSVSSTFCRQHQHQQQQQQHQHQKQRTRLNLFAPPGSGYARVEDDPGSELPNTYEPMMAFPGTMRPGKTPENMPFQDLPIGDDDPDPVPWPHFQQIEWHHRWSEPPHEHPGTMEDFIESVGRWATPEQEAAMRAGVRRDVRQRQELAEAEKRETIITDDDDDDDDDQEDYEEKEEPVALGDGIYGKLGSDADRAATAAAVNPDNQEDSEEEEEEEEVIEEDGGLDDFLLDLGLDAEVDDDDAGANQLGSEIDEEEDNSVKKSATSTFSVDDDDDLASLDLEDEDELETDATSTVPLEDFSDSDSENLETEDIFDEGGFDFGDSGDGDFGGVGDDVW